MFALCCNKLVSWKDRLVVIDTLSPPIIYLISTRCIQVAGGPFVAAVAELFTSPNSL